MWPDLELNSLSEHNLEELNEVELLRLCIIAAKLVGKYSVYMRHGIVPVGAESMIFPANGYDHALFRAKVIMKELGKRFKNNPEAEKILMGVCEDPE